MIFTEAELAYLDGQIAVVVDDLASRRPWTVRGVEIRGTARAVTGTTGLAGPSDGAAILLRPRRIISWGLGDEPGMRGRDIDPADVGGIGR